MSFSFAPSIKADPVLPPCRSSDWFVPPLSLSDITLSDLDIFRIMINNTEYGYVNKMFADGLLFTLQHQARIILRAGTRFSNERLSSIPDELFEEIGLPVPFVMHLLHIQSSDNPFSKTYSMRDLRSLFGAAHYVGRQATAWIEEAIRRSEGPSRTHWIWHRNLYPSIDNGHSLGNDDSDSEGSVRSLQTRSSMPSLFDERSRSSGSESPEDLSRTLRLSFRYLFLIHCATGALILHPTLSSRQAHRASYSPTKLSPIDPSDTVAELLAKLSTLDPDSPMEF